MNAKIDKKFDRMAARAGALSALSPSIQDRIDQAQRMVGSHPIDETRGAPAPLVSAVQTVPTGPGAFRVESVPLSLIDENPFNARHIYRPSRVSELVSSIGEHGQDTPGTATIRDGRYILAAGHYRRHALVALRAPSMLLVIRENITDRELYELSYRENAEREPQSALDNALSWRTLLDSGVYPDEASLAKSLGQSPANINKTLAILRLSESLRDMIAEDPSKFAMSALYELTLLEKEAGFDETRAMVVAIAAGEAGRKEVQELRAKLSSRATRKPKAFSRRYDIKGDGLCVGALREWEASGKVVLDVVFNDPKDRAQFIEEMRIRWFKDADVHVDADAPPEKSAD